MDKIEDIKNIIFNYLNNISDEELYKFYDEDYDTYIIGSRIESIKFTLNNIDIALYKDSKFINRKNKYSYTMSISGGTISLKCSDIEKYFNRVLNYCIKIEKQEKERHINFIWSKLKGDVNEE